MSAGRSHRLSVGWLDDALAARCLATRHRCGPADSCRARHLESGGPRDMMRRMRTLFVGRPWVVVGMPVVLYVLVFAPVRGSVGDVVGALSFIPILVAGSLLNRRKVWGVALAMVLVNGVLFGVTDQSRPTGEWQGAVVGSVALLVTADLIGRVRDNELRVKKTGDLKDRFLAGVSHELKTPITAIVGYASILKAPWPGLVDGEREDLLEVLHREAVNVASIVEDLLVAERLDIDDLIVSPGVVSPAREIEAVVDILGIEPHRLTVNVPSELTVAADGGRLRQILRNLISNAIRYGGPQVTIEAKTSAGSVSTLVIDNGKGLPRDEWELVFEPYYRSHQREGQPESKGLGLSVSRRLARRMGGNVTYRYLNHHSRFELTLPADQVESPPRIAAPLSTTTV